MALHFERDEFEARIRAARIALRRDKLDAILLFAPESHYYLTGYDTSGFVFFQSMVLTADDTLLCVPADSYARIEEMHILALHCLCDSVDCMLLGVD